MTTSKGPAEPLTRERIVDTALALIDGTGLDSLSMRRLGAELGVEAMAIYHWFPSKDALLDGVVERLLATGEHYPDGLDWADTYRWACTRLLGSVSAHPGAAGMFAIRPLDTPAAHEWLERPLAAARRAGFTEPQAAELSHAVLAYLVGWIVMSRTPDESRLASAKSPTAREVAVVAPEAARVRAQMAEWGKGFDDGLDAILGVWSLRLPPGTPATSPVAPAGAALEGGAPWIVQIEGGGKKVKGKGKKHKGKKHKKGS